MLLWQQDYDKSATGQHYKKLEPLVSRGIKFVCANRQKEVVITRLRLGKCSLNHYLHKIKRHADGLCANCQVPETIEHFLLDCPHSNLFNNEQITLSEALTAPARHDIIIRRLRQLNRRI
jgi:hypothetical protein